MEEKDVLLIDTLFDFSSVYKRNYCTLFNVKIFEVSIQISYTVDGKAVTLKSQEEKLYSIQYREWLGSKHFELQVSTFFSTEEKAKTFFFENTESFGLVKVTYDEAILHAKENLKLQDEMRQKINKG